MKLVKYILLITVVCQLVACKKDWLEAKSNMKLVVPTSVQDLQALLDNVNSMNSGQPALGEVSADNYYVLFSTWQNLTSQTLKNAYIWGSNFYEGESSVDWDNPYKTIFYANNVLEGIDKIAPEPAIEEAWKNVKGSALFYRGLSFFNLASLYAPPYRASTASNDPGILLKLTSDINDRAQRSSVQRTYDQLIGDLKQSIPLLPVTPSFKTRPSKPAAYGLLSRVYLSMGDYNQSLLYADSCLQLYSSLLDYNTLSNLNNPSSYALPAFNAEVIFHYTIVSSSIILNTRAIVDSNLFASFHSDDVRKQAFFKNSGGIRFRGSYTGSLTFFGGIATDEMYLNKAECLARKNQVEAAMDVLNTLLKKRWKSTVAYSLITASNQSDALNKILAERRKELVFRGGLRWIDLRRLNQEQAFAVTLKRELNGQFYTIAPNSVRYTLPIPDQEIRLTGIEQNAR